MRTHLLVLVALLAAPLAGCLDDGEASEEPASARELRDVADRRALEWSQMARLEAVFALEGDPATLNEHTPLDGIPELPNETESPGEGRPSAWAFLYRGLEEGLGVVVHANGSLASTFEHEPSEGGTIDDWSVDARQAAATAAEELDAWPPANGSLFYSLNWQKGSEDPVWVLGAVTGEGEMATARVDAATGERLGPVEGHSAVAFLPPPGSRDCEPAEASHAGSIEGSFEETGGNASRELSVPGPCYEQLVVRLELDQPATSRVNATLRALGGPRVNLSTDVGEPADEGAWARAWGGDHSLEVVHLVGGPQDYSVHWCGVGTEQRPPDNPACPGGGEGGSPR